MNALIANRISSFLNTNFGIFIVCSILSALFFVYYFGIAIINFGYTDWLMSDEIWADVKTSYTTWRFVLNADWRFPFLIDNVVNPFEMPIAFSPAPIIWSLLFKILSPIFPQNFQYFGFMYFIHYLLIGGIAGILINKLTRNSVFAILGSLIFLLSPYMLQRVYYHDSLTAHFIILLCIYFCIQNSMPRKLYKNIIIWVGLVVFATVQHFYFVPMVLFFMFAYLIDDYQETKAILRPIAVLATCIFCTLLVMFVCGFFYGETDTIIWGLRYWSANLNTFINSMGHSAFLVPFSLATQGQYEGFAYLGFGVILGIVFVIAAGIKQNITTKDIFTNPTITRRTILAFVVISAALIMALSPLVTVNQYIICNVELPKFIENIWGAFRSSGRMAWIVSYIITLFIVYAIYKLYDKKTSLLILAIVVIFQFADLDGYFKQKANPYKKKIEYQSKLLQPEWKILAEKYKQFFFMSENDFVPEQYKHYDIVYLAANNKCLINDHYISRKNVTKINEVKRTEWKNILDNNADSNKVYLFSSSDNAYGFIKEYCEKSLYFAQFNFYMIDDYVIGLREKEEFLKNYFLIGMREKADE